MISNTNGTDHMVSILSGVWYDEPHFIVIIKDDSSCVPVTKRKPSTEENLEDTTIGIPYRQLE